jgi:inner membrane protein
MLALIDVHLSLWHWFGLAIFLLILELLSGSGFLLWVAGAAVCTGIYVAISPTVLWTVQGAIFSGLALVVCLLWKLYWQRVSNVPEGRHLNQRAEQYLGQTYFLSEPILGGRGKIVIQGTPWQVIGDDLPLGSQVEIIATEGVLLKVRAVAAS